MRLTILLSFSLSLSLGACGAPPAMEPEMQNPASPANPSPMPGEMNPGAPMNPGTPMNPGAPMNPGTPDPSTSSPKSEGRIDLFSNRYTRLGNTVENALVSVMFLEHASGDCVDRTFGPCVVRNCVANAKSTPKSAGVVSITGTRQPLTLTPAAGAVYQPLSDDERLWNGGETITVKAAGGDVPAFQTTVATPKVVTTSALPVNGAVVPRTADLKVVWNAPAGAAGTVQVQMAKLISAPSEATAHLTCTFAAKDGSGTVPAGALGAMPAHDSIVGLSTVELAASNAGGFAVTVAARSMALLQDGQLAFTRLVLQ